MERFYVYIHVNSNGIFYIGKGCGERYRSKDYRNKHWKNTTNKYLNWKAIKLIKDLSEERAYEIEKILIELIGLDNLTNVCEGGGDCTSRPYDRRMEKNPMWGKIHPSKGKKEPQKGGCGRVGKKHSKDSILRNKISQPTRKKVVWEGIEYCSIAECYRTTGISKDTIKRINGIIDPAYIKRRKTKRTVSKEKLKYNIRITT